MKTSVVCRSPSWAGIMILPYILTLLASNVAPLKIIKNSGQPVYNTGIQYRAYGGGKSFGIQSFPESLWASNPVSPSSVSYNNEDINVAETTESKFDARSANKNRHQQVDESMVAQMLKNPDAMKMVLNYLTKQNLQDHQKKWNQMSKTKKTVKNKRKKNIAKKKPTTTPKPVRSTTTTQKNKAKTSKSPIIQITQINRRKDDVGDKTVNDKQKKKRRPRPPGGGGFFDLAQLFASLGANPEKNKKTNKGSENDKQRPPDLSFLFGPPLRNRPPNNRRPSQRPSPPPNADSLNNPQLMGDKPKLEYFGPSDFVPQHPYALPMQQHGPMRLTYMSAKEFPNIPKYGLIPIPRRRRR